MLWTYNFSAFVTIILKSSGDDERHDIYLINVQRDATQSSLFIILQVHSTCFGCPSNVAKLAWPCWREVAAQKISSVPEAVVTVLCTPDDGCV